MNRLALACLLLLSASVALNAEQTHSRTDDTFYDFTSTFNRAASSTPSELAFDSNYALPPAACSSSPLPTATPSSPLFPNPDVIREFTLFQPTSGLSRLSGFFGFGRPLVGVVDFYVRTTASNFPVDDAINQMTVVYNYDWVHGLTFNTIQNFGIGSSPAAPGPKSLATYTAPTGHGVVGYLTTTGLTDDGLPTVSSVLPLWGPLQISGSYTPCWTTPSFQNRTAAQNPPPANGIPYYEAPAVISCSSPPVPSEEPSTGPTSTPVRNSDLGNIIYTWSSSNVLTGFRFGSQPAVGMNNGTVLFAAYNASVLWHEVSLYLNYDWIYGIQFVSTLVNNPPFTVIGATPEGPTNITTYRAPPGYAFVGYRASIGRTHNNEPVITQFLPVWGPTLVSGPYTPCYTDLVSDADTNPDVPSSTPSDDVSPAPVPFAAPTPTPYEVPTTPLSAPEETPSNSPKVAALDPIEPTVPVSGASDRVHASTRWTMIVGAMVANLCIAKSLFG